MTTKPLRVLRLPARTASLPVLGLCLCPRSLDRCRATHSRAQAGLARRAGVAVAEATPEKVRVQRQQARGGTAHRQRSAAWSVGPGSQGRARSWRTCRCFSRVGIGLHQRYSLRLPLNGNHHHGSLGGSHGCASQSRT
jgi:hypothetical protein